MLGEPGVRINRTVTLPAGPDFEVAMRSGGLAGGADVADVLPGGDVMPSATWIPVSHICA
ncbi:hypothetical protein GCM10009555_098310 [Acrocarpospora macrocephala]|uniref:Uncharacterized protein n=1 Tax=Acrocarpospora macrocephala TaxID=150177 RepID=A0A5M3X2T2_9ACTN|nr:hypothetical protein [Acrocarpospora macrocephala]GES12588.1 hypothetical protein Amac_061850 [Acrocarpospora macrocephala]